MRDGRGGVLLKWSTDNHSKNSRSEGFRPGGVTGGPCKIGALYVRGVDKSCGCGAGNALDSKQRRAVVSNLNVLIALGLAEVSYRQPNQVAPSLRKINPERILNIVVTEIGSCQPPVGTTAAIYGKRSHVPAERYTIASGRIEIANYISLIRPIGNKAFSGAKVERLDPFKRLRWRRGS